MSRLPTKVPTPNEQDAYDLVKRSGGLQAAATASGRSLGAISSAVRVYVEKTGADWPVPRRPGPGMGRASVVRERNEAIAGMPERITALEELVGELKREISSLVEQSEDLAEGLRLFFARQPVILAPARDVLAPTHRRIADGGIGGRREARG